MFITYLNSLYIKIDLIAQIVQKKPSISQPILLSYELRHRIYQLFDFFNPIFHFS